MLTTVQQFITHSSPSRSEQLMIECRWETEDVLIFGLLQMLFSFGGTDDVTVELN